MNEENEPTTDPFTRMRYEIKELQRWVEKAKDKDLIHRVAQLFAEMQRVEAETRRELAAIESHDLHTRMLRIEGMFSVVWKVIGVVGVAVSGAWITKLVDKFTP